MYRYYKFGKFTKSIKIQKNTKILNALDYIKSSQNVEQNLENTNIFNIQKNYVMCRYCKWCQFRK